MNKNPRSGAISALGTRFTHVVSGRKLLAAIGLLLIVSTSLSSGSQSVTLAWDASSDPNVSGYRLRYGTTSGNPTQAIDVGRSTTAVVASLNDGTTYFFIVTAYNAAGLESNPSNEISYNTSAPPSNTHVLTVINGRGDGNYPPGARVPVSAEAPTPGQKFERWLRDYQILDDPTDLSTIATMPASDVTIEAIHSAQPTE